MECGIGPPRRASLRQRGRAQRFPPLSPMPALEGAGLVFIPENGGGAGVRLKRKAKR